MTVEIAWIILDLFSLLVLLYFVVLNSFYLATTIMSFRMLRLHARRLKSIDIEDLIYTAGAPPVTMILPAYNEAAGCVDSVRALLSQKYARFEVIVVDDGSTDDTMKNLIDAFNLVPVPRAPTSSIPTEKVREIYASRNYLNLLVIRKDNGGKSDALNTGLNYSLTPLFCAMDADSILDREALIRIVRPFLTDRRTVAAGGVLRIANGCTVENGVVREVRLPPSLLARFQVLEYLRAFLSGRLGWDALGATLIISGAFGIFKRSIVAEAGGFAVDTVGEDAELIVRLHRHCRQMKIPYRIQYVPDPVAWTECPETLSGLSKQRDRWQRGLIETLSRHRRMLFNPFFGRIGLIAYPYFFFLEMLGPVVELCGYLVFAALLLTGHASYLYTIAFLALAVVWGIALSISAVGLGELTMKRYPRTTDLLHLFALAVVENLGYRQLMTFFRVKAVFTIFSRRGIWGSPERKGFS